MEELLEEYYLEDSESFTNLAKKYSGGKVYDNILKMTDCIYKKAKSEVAPLQWVKKLQRSYDFQNDEEMFHSGFYKEAYQLCFQQLLECKDKLRDAVEIAGGDADVSDLADNAKEFMAVIDRTMECRDYRQLYEVISQCTLPVMSRKRKGMPEVDRPPKNILHP